MQTAIKIKRDKNNVTCIQCADKERFKTILKQSLAYRLHTVQCRSLLATVKVWYEQFVQHSINAVVFAVK